VQKSRVAENEVGLAWRRPGAVCIPWVRPDPQYNCQTEQRHGRQEREDQRRQRKRGGEPSSSMIAVPTRPENSNGVCQSQPFPAIREASTDMTAPARPSQMSGERPLEARPTGATAGPAEIIVDHLDVFPPQRLKGG
jgi:hypothetical protein